MPRARREEESDITNKHANELEEDYLDVDRPLPGQNYFCVSFVSPEKVLQKKEKYIYYNYSKSFFTGLHEHFDNRMAELIEKSEDGMVDVSKLVELKKNLGKIAEEYISPSYDKFCEKFEDYLYRDEEKLGEAFDKENNFQTSVRGVKVRGCFDTKREADVRAAVLQRQDPLFDVFVGQVGYWCPWDPTPTKIDDIEYMNNDLNKLVKEYKSNEAKKDAFYNEQKMQRQKDALSAEERLKHQEGLNQTKAIGEAMKKAQDQSLINNSSLVNTSLDNLMTVNELEDGSEEEPKNVITSLDVGGESSKEITLEEQTRKITGDDPWLQRKMEQMQATSDEQKQA